MFQSNFCSGLSEFTVLGPIYSTKRWAEALEIMTSLHCKQMTAFLGCFSLFWARINGVNTVQHAVSEAHSQRASYFNITTGSKQLQKFPDSFSPVTS